MQSDHLCIKNLVHLWQIFSYLWALCAC